MEWAHPVSLEASLQSVVAPRRSWPPSATRVLKDGCRISYPWERIPTMSPKKPPLRSVSSQTTQQSAHDQHAGSDGDLRYDRAAKPTPTGITSNAPAFPALPIYKLALVRENDIPFTHRPQVTSDTDAVKLLQPYFAGLDREHFVVLFLDAKNCVLGLNTVSIGSLTSSLAHPREILKPAILANAVAILLAHNHPIGISLLDHLVLGGDGRLYESIGPLEASRYTPRTQERKGKR